MHERPPHNEAHPDRGAGSFAEKHRTYRIVLYCLPDSVTHELVVETAKKELGRVKVIHFEVEEGKHYREFAVTSGTRLVPATLVRLQYEEELP